MAIEGRVLQPANENPWYVLMTLYGEQDGHGFDWEKHNKNRAAWNAWSCQAMSDEKRKAAATSSKVSIEELSDWCEQKDDICQRHKVVMLERNQHNPDFTYPSLPKVATKVNLAGVRFDQRLVMRSAVFSADADFGAATFCEGVEFHSATFCGQAAFSAATFSGLAVFNSTTFDDDTAFNSATFNGDAAFGGATFNADAKFGYVTFTRRAAFGEVTFSRRAWFAFATFSGGAHFNHATFSAEAEFGLATFSGFVYFDKSKFGTSGGKQRVGFTNCQFEKPTSFLEAIFSSVYPDFTGAVLHDKTAFTDQPGNWPLGKQINREQAKASCAVIRHNLGKQGLPEAEHFFFRREMQFSGQSGPLWQRPTYWLFGVISEYGYSILTPFLWLCLLIGGGALALAWGTAGSQEAVDIWHGVGLSLANVFNFLSFHKTFQTEKLMADLPVGLKALSGFQSIAGVILLFFLGLGLRTRFRMR